MDKKPEKKKFNSTKDIRIDVNNDLTYNEYEEPPTKNECIEYCCMCSGSILFLALIAAAICYIVFGIMYLVQDFNIASECSGSNLWAYCLTALILSLCRYRAKNQDNEEVGETLCMLFCLGILELALAIWGGIELWEKSCDDLSNSNLWKFGLATFCIQTFCATIFVFIIPICIICFASRSN